MAAKKIKEMNKAELQEYFAERYRKQNAAASMRYDRISVVLPIGTKDRIKATGQSINDFVSSAVLAALEQSEGLATTQDPDPDPEQPNDLPWNNL